MHRRRHSFVHESVFRYRFFYVDKRYFILFHSATKCDCFARAATYPPRVGIITSRRRLSRQTDTPARLRSSTRNPLFSFKDHRCSAQGNNDTWQTPSSCGSLFRRSLVRLQIVVSHKPTARHSSLSTQPFVLRKTIRFAARVSMAIIDATRRHMTCIMRHQTVQSASVLSSACM